MNDRHIRFDLSKNTVYIIDNLYNNTLLDNYFDENDYMNDGYNTAISFIQKILHKLWKTLENNISHSFSQSVSPTTLENMQSSDHNYITIVSSLLFLTNARFAYQQKYYTYAYFFLFLTISSLLYHYNSCIQSYILDQFAIYLVVLYGAYMLYNKKSNMPTRHFICIISTFFATILLYYYGYKTRGLCFSSDIYVANNYHALLHIISSIGHHLIIMI